jgi:hypothetical protein
MRLLIIGAAALAAAGFAGEGRPQADLKAASR